MTAIVYALPVLLLSVAFEAWLAHRRGLATHTFADTVTSINFGILSQVSNSFTKLVTLGIYTAVFENFRLGTWAMDSVWAWLLALLMHDFFYYWFHRFNHEVGIMWAAHVAHHNSEHFNISTALRQASGTKLLRWTFYLPLAVAGVPPVMFVVVVLIDLLYGYWNHTELIGKMGWFDRVFGSPSNHRVHHGQTAYCIDKNYGSMLIVWDRLFGTFEQERGEEPVVYGVRKPVGSFNPLRGNLQVYVALWREAAQATGWRRKLDVLLAPPGGWSDAPVAPFDAQAFKRQASHCSKSTGWYTVAQLVGGMAMLAHFLIVFRQLPISMALGYAALIVWTTLATGALLDGRAWGARLEAARLIASAVLFAALPLWFGSEPATAIKGLVVATALGSLLWLLRRSGSGPAQRGAMA